MTAQAPADALQVHDAGLARVLEAAMDSMAMEPATTPRPATLAIVLETEGSTYARPGTAVLFTAGGHVGWLSGGCLEPEIERRAHHAAASSRIGWIEIDTRDDSALFSGNAVGCRGRQRVVLLPLTAVPGCTAVFEAWLAGAGPLRLVLDVEGAVELSCAQVSAWRLAADPVEWPQPQPRWTLQWPPPPRAVLLGAGPEAGPLQAHLRSLGWQVRLLEPRAAWRARCPANAEDARAEEVLSGPPVPDAVLVMHHNFELDLEALIQLAPTTTPFIGLLGPKRRREDLFALLSQPQRESLVVRLHSPVGLELGGRGPEAIALSIAAELQAWHHDPSLRRA